MPHDTALIATMSVALALAFVGGHAGMQLRRVPADHPAGHGIEVGDSMSVQELGVASQVASVGRDGVRRRSALHAEVSEVGLDDVGEHRHERPSTGSGHMIDRLRAHDRQAQGT